MTGKIDFDLPLWSAEIYHSERGATNPWTRVFNVIEVADSTVNEKEALKQAVALFKADGLAPVTIYQLYIERLEKLVDEGGN